MNKDVLFGSSIEDAPKPRGQKSLFVISLISYILLFIPFLNLSFSPGGDVPGFSLLVASPYLILNTYIPNFMHYSIAFNFLCLLSLIFIVLIFYKNRIIINKKINQIAIKFTKSRVMILIFILSLTIGYGVVYATERIILGGQFNRYSPLITFPYLIISIVIGLDEMSIRLFSIIFSFLSLFLLFKLNSIYYNWKIGILSAIVLGSTPLFFLFSHYVHNSQGLVFLCIWFLYQYLKYLKFQCVDDYYYAIVIANFGMSYRLEFGLLPLSVLIYHFIRRERPYIIKMIKHYWIITLPAVFYLFLRDPATHVIFTKETIPIWQNMLLILPNTLNDVIFLLFVFSLIFVFLQKNSPLVLISLIWIFTWTLFFGFQAFYTHERFYVPMMIPILVIIFNMVDIVNKFINRKVMKINFLNNKKRHITIIKVLFIVIILSYNSFVLINSSSDQIENNYLPYDETFEYLSTITQNSDKVYFPTEFSHHTYYMLKYDVKCDINQVIWIDVAYQSINNLISFVSNGKYTHLILSLSLNGRDWGEEAARADYGYFYVNQSIIFELYANYDLYGFQSIKEFIIGTNVIFILT